MLVNKLGVDVLLLMLCRLRFCKSFQSDNYVYYDLNNSASKNMAWFIGIFYKLRYIVPQHIIGSLYYALIHPLYYMVLQYGNEHIPRTWILY